MEKVVFQESSINLTGNRKGKVAVFMYVGEKDPVAALDLAVSQYVGHKGHMQFIDINMDNPWTRLVLSGVNDMEQVDFNPLIHKL